MQQGFYLEVSDKVEVEDIPPQGEPVEEADAPQRKSERKIIENVFI